MELESIPGVGRKTASALRELDDPVTALTSGDVLSVAQAPGITTGRAVTLVRRTQQARHEETTDFLATDRARELYKELLTILQHFAVTRYGKQRLATFYPSGTESRVRESRAFTRGALAVDTSAAVGEALAEVSPLADPRGVWVRDRCLATADADTQATASEAIPELSVEHVEETRDIVDLASGYAEVIVLDETFAGMDFPDHVRVEPDALTAPETVVPERYLAFVGTNATRISAAIQVHRRGDLEASCSLATIESMLEGVTDEGTLVGDDRLRRLRNACDDLEVSASTAESVATDHLRDIISRRDVTVEGTDLLTLAERGARVESLLDRELADELETARELAIDHVVDALPIDPDDREDIARIFPPDGSFPIERDRFVFDRFDETLADRRDRHERHLKRERAAAIVTHLDDIDAVVERALEYDLKQAIARFYETYGCTMPSFEDTELTIVEGRPLPLAAHEEDVERVTYHVDGVTLLTGVNSGGKTTTLDMLASVSILAHMGLPVPAASATVPRFDQLHYHGSTKGTLDAGAFETTVMDFAALVTAPANSLILVDELESITEPGASAKLIAGFLEALKGSEATAVFVTHLAEEIADELAVDVAIDGIVASGIVDGELLVDRSPRKDHLARSTPELIIAKLTEEHPDTGFYTRVLEKFDGTARPKD